MRFKLVDIWMLRLLATSTSRARHILDDFERAFAHIEAHIDQAADLFRADDYLGKNLNENVELVKQGKRLLEQRESRKNVSGRIRPYFPVKGPHLKTQWWQSAWQKRVKKELRKRDKRDKK